MYIEMIKCKIHRATVTDTGLNYVGSITISEDIMKKEGINQGLIVAIPYLPPTLNKVNVQRG